MKRVKIIFLAIALSLGVVTSNFAQVIPQDSLALVALYDSLGGAGWNNSSNWKSTSQVKLWYGITVFGNRVTQIDLNYNNLSGVIPNAIGDLTALSYLYMRGNQITGNIPHGLGKNAKEEYIPEYRKLPEDDRSKVDGGDNHIRGTLPKTIGNLTSLISLDLYNNDLFGPVPADFGNLSSLTEANLGNNQLTALPNTIGGLVNLENLYLYNNDLDENSIPAEIAQLNNLRTLDISGNQFTIIPDSVFALDSLQSLYISSNIISSIPVSVANLTALQTLDASWNQLNGTLPSELSGLGNLRELYLSGNGFNDIPTTVTNLLNLTALSMGSNGLDGSDLSALGNMINLTYLGLWDNPIANLPPEMRNLTALTTLDLGSTYMLNSDGIAPIQDMVNLQQLYLSSNKLTRFPTEILNLSQLATIYLQNNEIDDFIPQEFTFLPNLYRVYLYYNKFHGAIPDSIINLSNLGSFRIYENNFDYLPDMTGMPGLYDLNAYNNKLSFDDIERNMGGGFSFSYNPQKTIGGRVDTLIAPESDITLTYVQDSPNNINYQWYKDNVAVPGATGTTFSITGAKDGVDEGEYTLEMQNSVITGMTLKTDPYNVVVGLGNILTFQVDMSVQKGEGNFNPGAGDSLLLSGSFNNWTFIDIVNGTTLLMSDNDGDDVYDVTLNVYGNPNDIIAYKFAIRHPGGPDVWETNNNRQWTLSGDPTTLPVVYFSNDFDISITDINVTVLFRVDMNSAVERFNNQPLNNLWSVWINGSFTPLGIGGWTGWAPSDTINMVKMYDDGSNGDEVSGDNIWSRNVIFPSGYQQIHEYKYGAWAPGVDTLNGGVVSMDNEADYQDNHDLYIVDTDPVYTPPVDQWKSKNTFYIRQVDSLALVTLYDSLGGSNWYDNSNWNTSATLENWFGVTMTNGRVTKLELNSNNLSGVIPGALGDLNALTWLNMGSNSLTGQIPSVFDKNSPPSQQKVAEEVEPDQTNHILGKIPTKIGRLVNLTYLNLSYNQLSGTIPDDIIYLSNLQILDLNNNQLSGLSTGLAYLTNLEELYLRSNQLTDASIPTNFGQIPNLKILRLDGNQLTVFPAAVTEMTTLEYLYIYGNAISSIPASIGNMASLNYLHISNNPLGTSIPPEFANLSNLLTIFIEDCAIPALPAGISGLPNLQQLYMSNNPMPGNSLLGIGNLNSLTYLGLNYCQLDSLPYEMGNLTSLNGLPFNDNNLTSDGLAGLQNLTSQVGWLDLSDNQLTRFPTEVLNMNNMYQLSLQNNAIADSLPSAIANLTNLQYFYIYNNQFFGTVPVQLTALTNLYDFELYNNDLDYLPDFSALGNFWYMYAENNRFSFDDIERNAGAVRGTFRYNPQKGLGSRVDTLLSTGFNYTMQVDAPSSNNSFQWYKDGVAISGATSNSYSIINADEATHEGEYYCEITNSVITDLTLRSDIFFIAIGLGNNLTFQVDMNVAIGEGLFDPANNDSVLLGGSFAGWSTSNQWMSDANLDNIYDLTVDINGNPNDVIQYKFGIRKAGSYTQWEGNVDPLNPNFGDRQYTLTGDPDSLAIVFFDNDDSVTVISQDVLTNFQVDMNGATNAETGLPLTNLQAVYMHGTFNQWSSFSISNIANLPQLYDDGTHGDATPGDNIWSGSIQFTAGTQMEHEYQFGALSDEANAQGYLVKESVKYSDNHYLFIDDASPVYNNPVDQWKSKENQYLGVLDSLALVALYDSLNGDNWNNTTNWKTGEVLESWFGVTVAGNRVTRLELSGNNLVGELPRVIGSLTGLTYLDLGSNGLSGSIPKTGSVNDPFKREKVPEITNHISGKIPAAIGNLTKLTYLSLAYNYNLSGAIPNEIGNLTELTELRLQYNQFETLPPGIGNLTKLNNLYIYQNNLTGLPDEIGGLSSLSTLDVSSNNISSLPATIVNLTNLQNLSLQNNKLTSLPNEMGNMTALYYLYLENNNLTTLPASLSNLTNLRYLYLRDNSFGGNLPPAIWSFTSVYYLHLNGLALNGDDLIGIGNLTNLRQLYLNDNQLDSIPAEFSNLDQVYYLQLYNNNLTKFPMAVIGMTGLSTLNLENNQISDVIPDEIGRMGNLSYLYLNDNKFYGAVPDSILLTSLQQFEFGDNMISGLPNLSALTNLNGVRATNNRLGFGDIIPNIGVPSSWFYYDPQDRIGQRVDTLFAPGSSFTMMVKDDHPDNSYQWYLNNSPISGATSYLYSISNADEATDEGVYHCVITNSSLTDLTLLSQPVTIAVGLGNFLTFQVDMNVQAGENVFDPAQDSVLLRGSFNDWGASTDTLVMEDLDGDLIYDLTIEVEGNPNTIIQYKYVIRKAGGGDIWEENVAMPPSDANRTFTLTGDALTLPVVFFSNDNLVTITTQDVTTRFKVDMNFAAEYYHGTQLQNISAVFINGPFLPGGWQSWDVADSTNLIRMNDLGLNGDAVAGDNIWTGEYLFPTGAQQEIIYKYGAYADGVDTLNGGIGQMDNEAGFGEDRQLFVDDANSLFEPGVDQWKTKLASFVRELDSLALVAIYDSLGGDNWNSNSNWKTTALIDTWYGVTVNSGRVTRLSLSGNNLVGIIPSEIGNLSALDYLHMGNNSITDLPPDFRMEDGRRMSIEEVDAIGKKTGDTPNKIMGKIPKRIGELTNLTYLNLRSNQLNGSLPSSFGNLRKLVNLYLEYNSLDSLPPEFGQLSDLEYVNFYNNDIQKLPQEIGNLSKLREINLSRNALTEFPAGLINLPDFEVLWIYGNQISTLPDNIGNMAALKRLDISSNQIASLPESFGNLSHLENLQLSYNLLTTLPASFSNLYSLTNLGLSGNAFDGVLPALLGDLNNLTQISLYDLNLDDDDMGIFSNMLNLTSFYIGYNNLTTVPAYISTFTSLTGIALEYNNLTNDGLAPLADLTNLSYVELSGNMLTQFPAEVLNSPNLYHLYLRSNDISGSIPDEIGRLTNLRYFQIENNDLSGAVTDSIVNMTNLYRFYIYNNDLDYLPDLSPLNGILRYLYIDNNAFDFEDIEKQLDLSFYSFRYSPMDSLGEEIDTLKVVGEDMDIVFNIGGSANTYTWYKDDQVMSGQSGNTLAFTGLSQGNSGSYRVEVTSSAVSGLTLYTRPVNLTVVDNNLTFRVNMAVADIDNRFIAENGDDVQLAGDFNGWATNDITLTDNDGDYIYSATVDVGMYEPGDTVFYKFVIHHSDGSIDWEGAVNPSDPDGDRAYEITGNPDILPEVYFDNSGFGGSFAEDSTALVAIYNALGGPNWNDHNNWLTAVPVSQWFGVGKEYGRVTELNLPDNNLQGNLPAEIGNLYALRNLDLGYNGISNPSAKMKDGQSNFDIALDKEDRPYPRRQNSNNKSKGSGLIGKIPSSIGNLVFLNYMNLSENGFSGALPNEIGNLSRLQILYAGWNNFTSVPSSIANISGLLRFSVRDNQMSDGSIPVEIGNLNNLQYLNLMFNQLSILPLQVTNLNSLNTLYLNDNQFTAIPGQIGNLTNLTRLFLSNNPLNGTLPSTIGNLTDLQNLQIENVGLTTIPAFVGGLNNLSSLGIGNNPIVVTSGTFSSLSGISGLVSLELPRMNLKTIPSEITSMTSLITLDLSYNEIDNQGLSGLENLINLTVLVLDSNQLAQFPPEILLLDKLEWLIANDNNMAGSVPANISSLDSLRGLYLANNILETVPNSILLLNNLSELDFSNNILTDIPPFAGLFNLYIPDNRLTFEQIVPNIGAASNEFVYAPQDSAGQETTFIIGPNNNFMIETSMTEANNVYEWYKNGSKMDGATTPSINFSNLSFADEGVYECVVNNSQAPDLTLYTRPQTLLIGLAPEVITPEAIEIKVKTAILSAFVNPGNFPTTVEFEYGTSESLGNVQLFDSTLTGSINKPVSYALSGLTSNQTYFFRITATNLAGVQSTAIQSFTTIDYPATISVNNTFTFPAKKPKRSDYTSADWKLAGFPGALDIGVETIFTGDPHNDWEVIWDDGSAGTPEDYLKTYVNNDTYRFKPGRGFWILSTSNVNVNNADVPSVTLNAKDEFNIDLKHQGWIIISNPFPVSISWEAVKTTNGVSQSIYEFSGNAFTTSTAFEPYKAYYFNNASNLSNLKIPLVLNSKKKMPTIAMDWQVNIQMKNDNYQENLASVGISNEASQELDEFDKKRPGIIGRNNGIYMIRESWNEIRPQYLNDYRNEIGNIQIWDFNVSAPDKKEIVLGFSDIDSIPEGFQAVLVDFTHAKHQDLREFNQYEYMPPYQNNRFSFIVGKAEYVETELAKLLPQKFTLGQNYPNPFNPQTSIPVEIPEAREVILTVYNVMGQKIKTLYNGVMEPGRHFVKWVGDNEAGIKMSSGTYFYHLTVKNGTSSTGKMILLK